MIRIILAKYHSILPNSMRYSWSLYNRTLFQPENGKHPQAVINELVQEIIMYKQAIAKRPSTEYTITTHSSDIVNFIGRLIEEEVLNVDDVRIELYSQNEPAKVYHYNKDGVIENWSFGYFNYDESEAIRNLHRQLQPTN